jgi:subtilisin family serine protease
MRRRQIERASVGARRFHPQVERLEVRTVPTAYAASDVLVQFEPGFDAAALPGGAHVLAQMPLVSNLDVVSVPPGWSVSQMLDGLGNNPHVRFAQPDYVLQAAQVPNDTKFPTQWGLNNTGQTSGTLGADIHAEKAWDVTTGTGKEIVAVLDSGIDYTHPDLAANMWPTYGYNFVANTNNPMDDNGHGTLVAGIIGAVGNNGVGIAGIDWNVQLMAVKVLDSTGSGLTSTAIQGLNYAVANGAKIVNASWGSTGYDQALQTAIASARAQGVIFVAAAGNSSTNNDVTPIYPASYSGDNIVAVAATDQYDNLASFSNYGPTSVALAAPGMSVQSTYVGGGYAYMSGTSAAAPFVSGAMALVWDLHPTWSYSQVIHQVLSTVDPLPGLAGKLASGGRLDLAAAVGTSAPPASSSLTNTPGGTVVVGNANLTDAATLSNGNNPTGSITFTLYAPGSTTAPLDTETVAVNGNGTYRTPAGYLPSSTGSYQWVASYSGDAGNAAASASGTESVSKASPTIVMQASPGGQVGVVLTDTATLSGGYSVNGGTITFTLTAPNGAQTVLPPVPVTNGDGSYSTPSGITATMAGTYTWSATYSGNATNNPATDNGVNETSAQAIVTPPPVTLVVSGLAFDDVNGNGVYNNSDARLAGWAIQLYQESDGTSGLQTGTGGDRLAASALTDANGNYAFNGLVPGTYYVREVAQSGWVQTVGNMDFLNISTSQTDNHGNAHVMQSTTGPQTLGYYANSANGQKDLTGSRGHTQLSAGVYNYLFGTGGVLLMPGSTTLSVLVGPSGTYQPVSYFQSYTNLTGFLKIASINPANQLSAQLLVTELNVYFGRLNPLQYIYTPNVTGLTTSAQNSLAANGIGTFVQISTLLRDTVTELLAAPNVASSSTDGVCENALELCFESINGNKQVFVL